MLLKEKKGGQKLKPSDIGIISPYRKQVLKNIVVETFYCYVNFVFIRRLLC
jgi:hypothetical protein